MLIENLPSDDDDRAAFAAYQASRARLGLPPVAVADYMAGRITRNSLPARKRVSVATTPPTESPFAYMSANFKMSDSLIAALETELLGRDGITLSDVGRASFVVLKMATMLPLDSFRVNGSVADVAKALGIAKSQMSKTISQLTGTSIIKIDASSRPARVYMNPSLIWRGSTKEQGEAVRQFDAMSFPR